MLGSTAAAPAVAWCFKLGICSSILPPARSGKAAHAGRVAAAWIAFPGVRLLSEREKCGLLGRTQRSSRAAPLLMKRPSPGGSPGMLRKKVENLNSR